jgi:asparagine synthase (glutamine-hydrolysing)
MCGILGSIWRDQRFDHHRLDEHDLHRLSHRGPDGQGSFTSEHVQLGHTRLAIVDLTDAGHQPMSSSDGRYVVTFNGEIYNHVELRSELEARGERFFTQSDTEVLLVAYRQWGRDCVTRFRGMFAFALWDKKETTLLLARDRCGEKPLFYHRDRETLTFASELKALVPLLKQRPALEPAVVDMYLHYQYVPEPFTLLEGVRKLPAAHTLTVSLANWQAEPQRYWNVESVSYGGCIPVDTSGILASIREGLEDAVKMTLRADVPVAVALSGGIDSGAIAAFAQKHYPEPMHAFCVGYPGRPSYDERSRARALGESLGMIVHEVELPVESFVSFFPQLVAVMDEPIADPAAFGHYSVPKSAAEMGIKVLLTGIGGDEIFWGYNWVTQTVATNQLLARYPSLRTLVRCAGSPFVQRGLAQLAAHSLIPRSIQRWAGSLRELADSGTPEEQLRFYMAESNFPVAFSLKGSVYGEAMRSLTSDTPFHPTAIGARATEAIPAAIIRLLFDTWMVSNAVALGDRVSMSVGVEARLPFLDAPLIERVMALRARTPDHRLGQKAWLRAALKGVLPEEVLSRPKAGFQPPVWEWLSGVTLKYREMLYRGVLVRQGIIDGSRIEESTERLSTQGWDGLFFLYKLVLLEFWYQTVVAGRPVEQLNP